MKRYIIALIIYLLTNLAAYEGAPLVKAEMIKLLMTYYHIKAIIPLTHMP